MDPIVDYQAVLADLKARREALDKVIAHLEVVVGTGAITNWNVFATQKPKDIHGDTFVGRNIPEAAAKYLKMVGQPARTTVEITEALNKGGLTCSAGSVATVLGREFGRQAGEVVRASKGLWGLESWYPSRPRTKRRDSEDEEESTGVPRTPPGK